MQNKVRKNEYINIEEYINSNIFKKNNIYIFPYLHGRLEFTIALNSLLSSVDFDALAVELPHFMKKNYCEAIARLPYLSAVCVETGGCLHYHITEPQDSICEAVRTFNHMNKDIHFIDRFVDEYRDHNESYPDPYSLKLAGYNKYCGEYFGLFKNMPLNDREHDDLAREQYMAARLQQLSGEYGGKILFVCGLYHYPAVLKMLDYENTLPFYSKSIERVYVANLSNESHSCVLGEPPFIIKHYEALKGSMPNKHERPDTEIRPDDENILKINFGGIKKSVQNEIKPGDEILRQTLDEIEKKYFFPSIVSLDRELLNIKLIKTASANYLKNTGSEVPQYAFPIMAKFLKNYVRYKGLITAHLYELVTAARASVDDNFAYELFEAASDYPWIDKSQRYTTVNIGLDDLKLGGKTIRFHRKMKSVRQIFAPYVKKRHREAKAGEWLREWDENKEYICSHQPEDIIIENFGNFLRKKAHCALTDEQSRVEAFTSSLMDGLDTRETIRNYHYEKKLYVKVSRNAKGAVGSVIVVFDEDAPASADYIEKYPYKMTWLGEHNQESDMAFYSSAPGEKIVGPGISRCEYGGFMLSYPPGRLYDIWNDPSYFMAKTKPEILLLASLDYSAEKFVVYCAKKPPRTLFKSIASRLGKKIVYIPFGQFSPITLKKLQAIHILNGKSVRKIAKEYIW